MYCNTLPSVARFLCHNTLQCIVIQTSTIQPQYNMRLAIQFTHCTSKLQYTSPIAIQFSSHSNPSLAIQFQQPSPLAIHLILQYKPRQPALPRLQYRFSIKIQLGSTPNQFFAHLFFFFFFVFHLLLFFIYFQLLENAQKKYIYTFFFSHTCYWKNTQKHKYTFFFLFFQLLEDTQKNIPIFFSFSRILK